MFKANTQAASTAIEQIGAVITANPTDPRVDAGIAELKQTASDIANASSRESEPQLRSAANVVADGLLAAANICSRLQEA